MDHQDGNRVADGTANVGGADPQSALQQRIGASPAPTGLRILEGLEVGSSVDDVETRVSPESLAERLAVITEPHAAYTEDSPWGRAAIPPSLMVRAMRVVEPAFLERRQPVVGLFGAIEVQHINGPVFADTPYRARGRVLVVSDTPKTEYFWYESTLYDDDGDVASMLMMLRFMKASSPLWD